MAAKPWAISLVLFTTLLTSSAQIFYKMGMQDAKLDYTLIFNLYLWIGLILYGIGAILLVIALKGGDLSVLYPIIATSYIWVGIMSWILFHEAMNVIRWLGITSIFFGVVFIGIGSRHSPEVH